MNAWMRRGLAATLVGLALTGCAGMTTEQQRVLGGAGVGAAIGGVIGSYNGCAGCGAAIGGAIGGLGGWTYDQVQGLATGEPAR